MAKTIKSKVEYQVTELVNNLNSAATTTSEQKRDFFTTKALYNAKRLSTIVNKAKIGAMALVLSMSIVACGGNVSTEQTHTDSVSVGGGGSTDSIVKPSTDNEQLQSETTTGSKPAAEAIK
jgi:hypothetical protein